MSNEQVTVLKSVLIIEDDPNWRKLLKKTLRQVGFMKIKITENSEEAWKILEKDISKQYDIIILDWKLDNNTSGLPLLNRIRNSDVYRDIAVLVVSGYLQGEDYQLFEEFPMTTSLEKPVNEIELKRVILELIQESIWFEKQKNELSKFFTNKSHGGAQGFFILRKLINESPNPTPIVIAAGKSFIEMGRYEEAEELLSYFLDSAPNCLMGINQLAKVYLHTKRFSEANSILIDAQKHSSLNLDRLCMIGDSNLQGLQIDQAQSAFKSALRVDGKSLIAINGNKFTSKIATLPTIVNVDTIPKAYASILNSSGIAAVRSHGYQDAIDQYRSAMIYSLDPMVKARVAFNIGLAFCRWKKLDEALPWFRRSVQISNGLFQKAVIKEKIISKQVETKEIPMDEIEEESIGKIFDDSSEILEDFEEIEVPDDIDMDELYGV